MRYTYFVLLVVIALSFPVWATEEDVLFGCYSMRSKDLTIAFKWNENGITNMVINNHQFSNAQISYEHSGDPESYLIRIRDKETRLRILRLVFLKGQDRVLLVSGLYADLQFEQPSSDKFKVIQSKTIEMRIKPLNQ